MRYLPAGGAQPVLIGADAVPAEAADLVAACAGEEVDIIDLQRLHAQGALHGVFLQLGSPGHPTAPIQPLTAAGLLPEHNPKPGQGQIPGTWFTFSQFNRISLIFNLSAKTILPHTETTQSLVHTTKISCIDPNMDGLKCFGFKGGMQTCLQLKQCAVTL